MHLLLTLLYLPVLLASPLPVSTTGPTTYLLTTYTVPPTHPIGLSLLAVYNPTTFTLPFTAVPSSFGPFAHLTTTPAANALLTQILGLTNFALGACGVGPDHSRSARRRKRQDNGAGELEPPCATPCARPSWASGSVPATAVGTARRRSYVVPLRAIT